VSPIISARGGLSSRAYGQFTAAGSLTSYESIATVTVGSGGQSTISFTSIPSTFTHLQIRTFARTTRNSSTGDFYAIRFNSDSGANYIVGHQLYGDGTTTGSFFNGASGNQIYIERIPALNSTANVFGAINIDILDYKNTNKYKTTRALGGWDNNGTTSQIAFASGAWMSTTAISSISITSGTISNFVEYSSFALYGIKGA
jgi:hypothetical protein